MEIPNAQLQLTEGQTFRRENPAPGIAVVEVSQSAVNTVRVTVTGVDDLPDETVVQSQSGLLHRAYMIQPITSNTQSPVGVVTTWLMTFLYTKRSVIFSPPRNRLSWSRENRSLCSEKGVKLIFLVLWFWRSACALLIQEEVFGSIILINTVNLGRSLQGIRKPEGIHAVFAVTHLFRLNQAFLL